MVRFSAGHGIGEVKSYVSPNALTVAEALTMAGLTLDGGKEVRVNSLIASLTQMVNDDDLITVADKVKGNCFR